MYMYVHVHIYAYTNATPTHGFRGERESEDVVENERKGRVHLQRLTRPAQFVQYLNGLHIYQEGHEKDMRRTDYLSTHTCSSGWCGPAVIVETGQIFTQGQMPPSLQT